MKFSINSSVNMTSKYESADLVTFTEEILNGKLHFCAVINDMVKEKSATGPFLYPLKTLENLWFSDVFWM